MIIVRYEIVVILEGVIEQTGNTIQVSSMSLKFFLDLIDRFSVYESRNMNDNDISLSVQFFPRLAPLTFPTRCCGVTASSTSSTSSIPSPSTKSTIHHSTQSTSKKSLHKLGDLFTLKAALDPYPFTHTHREYMNYRVEMSQLSQELKDQCSEKKDENGENGEESEKEESRPSYSPSLHPSLHPPSPARCPLHL